MSSNVWQLTIIRLSAPRPKKEWQSVVTIQVESGEGRDRVRTDGIFEKLLGSDGQPCVDQRAPMAIYDLEPSSQISISVWHVLPGKKRKQRRSILVSSANRSIGNLLESQQCADRSFISEIGMRLADQNESQATSTVVSGNSQIGPTLRLKLVPPSTLRFPLHSYAVPSRSPTFDMAYSDNNNVYTKGKSESWLQKWPASPPSERLSEKDWPILEMVNLKTSRRDRQQVSNLRRRVNNRNARSNDENFEPEELQAATRIPSESPERMNLKEDDNYSQNNDLDDREEEDSSMTPYADRCPSHSTSREQTPNDFTIGSSETFPTSSMAEGVIYSDSTCDAYSLIPTQSQGLLPSPGGMTLMERLLSQFTLYDHMHRARSPADFQNIKIQFQSECTTVGALLFALAGVNTAMFTIQSGGTFSISQLAKYAVAMSSATAGLGIACIAWFFMRYHWTDTSTFMSRTRDVRSTDEPASYMFFALTARIPAICMFISACAITACLALIAFSAFPTGVSVLFFVVGVLMALQFIIFGVSWMRRHVVRASEAVRQLV